MAYYVKVFYENDVAKTVLSPLGNAVKKMQDFNGKFFLKKGLSYRGAEYKPVTKEKCIELFKEGAPQSLYFTADGECHAHSLYASDMY